MGSEKNRRTNEEHVKGFYRSYFICYRRRKRTVSYIYIVKFNYVIKYYASNKFS